MKDIAEKTLDKTKRTVHDKTITALKNKAVQQGKNIQNAAWAKGAVAGALLGVALPVVGPISGAFIGAAASIFFNKKETIQASPNSLSERIDVLVKLEQLRKDSVITDAEFQEKKAILLDLR